MRTERGNSIERAAQADAPGDAIPRRDGVAVVVAIVLSAFGLVVATLVLLPERWCVLVILLIATVVSVVLVVLRRAVNAMLAAATVLGCLTLMEIYANVNAPRDIRPRGVVTHPVLGKAPGTTGLLRHAKFRVLTGSAIFDVTYTINERYQRNVISASTGPTIAFFGDSFTFGEGVGDNDTLPQIVSDLTERQLRVLNLAFSSYGTSQFLRILETGRDDDQLTELRAVVMQTALWHAERTACRRWFVPDSPRYELADGKAVWQGTCRDVTWFRINTALSVSAFYRSYIEPILARVTPRDIDLYVSTLLQAGRIAREKFGVPTVILYLPWAEFAKRSGVSDEEIMRRLSDGGLIVINGYLDRRTFPGQPLTIPDDGHPTGLANRLRARMLLDGMKDILASTRAQ